VSDEMAIADAILTHSDTSFMSIASSLGSKLTARVPSADSPLFQTKPIIPTTRSAKPTKMPQIRKILNQVRQTLEQTRPLIRPELLLAYYNGCGDRVAVRGLHQRAGLVPLPPVLDPPGTSSQPLLLDKHRLKASVPYLFLSVGHQLPWLVQTKHPGAALHRIERIPTFLRAAACPWPSRTRWKKVRVYLLSLKRERKLWLLLLRSLQSIGRDICAEIESGKWRGRGRGRAVEGAVLRELYKLAGECVLMIQSY
jgi:hypothetical protein